MKKYYLDDIDIYKIKNYNFDVSDENIIITNDGLIKIIKDEYFLFSFINKSPKIIENFHKNNNLYIDNSYFKKIQQIYQIPIEHKFLNITFHKYNIDQKNKIYFVKEILNKNVIDYYFQCDSKINIDTIQNCIFTFLTRLTNI